MRNYEDLKDKIKNWSRIVLEGDYINQSIMIDDLNNRLVDLHEENKKLKQEIYARKWGRDRNDEGQ